MDEQEHTYRRYFQIAGITLQVESDLPMDRVKFALALQPFEVQKPGEDLVTLRHVFGLPEIKREEMGELLYQKAPWAIHRKGDSYVYLGILPDLQYTGIYQVAIFNKDHTYGIIYHPSVEESRISQSGFTSLTLLVTDQILVAQLLADRQGCYLHAAGAILDGQGLLFVGHSSAGKSTTMRMLQNRAEILCDDRIIVRRWPEGFRIHGTWSHGELSDVSPNSAPLRAILFLKKSSKNELELLTDRPSVVRQLVACLIRPLVTRQWWGKKPGFG